MWLFLPGPIRDDELAVKLVQYLYTYTRMYTFTTLDVSMLQATPKRMFGAWPGGSACMLAKLVGRG